MGHRTRGELRRQGGESSCWRTWGAERSVILLGRVAVEADRVGDVVELLVADLFELLAFGGEFLVDLDGFLGHDLVGLLGATHQNEVGAGGEALVAVGIESEAKHDGLAPSFLFARVWHGERVRRGKAAGKQKVES